MYGNDEQGVVIARRRISCISRASIDMARVKRQRRVSNGVNMGGMFTQPYNV